MRPEAQEVERRFEEVKAKSGKLLIYGKLRLCRWEEMQFICDLGYGSFGHVKKYEYSCHQMRHPMAVKEMPRTNIFEDDKKIMMDLDVGERTDDCPHIVKCYGYFITEYHVRICMEVMATCLDKLMKNKLKDKFFPQSIVGKVVVSVLDALYYLKNVHKVIHRDVKPSNILINYDGKIKLCDFGISGFLVESRAKTLSAGCPPYMAPERLMPAPGESSINSSYDVRSDVWSLGITTVELATGRFPYTTVNEFICLIAITETDPPRLKVRHGFAQDLCDFVAFTLNRDVNKRPFYTDILPHPYILRSRAEKTDVGLWLEEAMYQME